MVWDSVFLSQSKKIVAVYRSPFEEIIFIPLDEYELKIKQKEDIKLKIMLREDNSGFINFPNNNPFINKIDTGKTFVYIIAFDSSDLTKQPYELSKVHISMPGTFVSDDINQRPKVKEMQNMSIDDLIEDQLKNDEYDSVYFPNFSGQASLNKILSIPMTSCICIGWSDFSFELRDSIGFWNATFRDLTNEGRRMYYGLKKLHNNKEVRILTFNNI